MTSAQRDFTVTEQDTALALGSGDLKVLGTPRLLAWCEAATCLAASELLDQQGAQGVVPDQSRQDTAVGSATTVGTRVALEHVGASGLGDRVRVSATLLHRDGRLLRFAVSAQSANGALIASGEVTRVVVERERFMARLAARDTSLD